MKRWKGMALAGLLLLGVLSNRMVYAEPGGGEGAAAAVTRGQETQMKDQVAKRVAEMTKRLDLTAEQQDALTGIYQDNLAKINELRSDTSLSEADRRTKLQELRKTTGDKISSILTTEQQAKQEALRKESAERRKKGATAKDAPVK